MRHRRGSGPRAIAVTLGRAAAAGGLVVMALAAMVAGAPPAHATEPTIALDRQQAAVGEHITVRLSGWPAALVSVELCGDNARRGSADCALDASVQRYVPPTGDATMTLTATAPVVGCPCVVRASTIDHSARASAPIALIGVTSPVTVHPDTTVHTGTTAGTSLAITSLRVRRELGWSLLGGPATVTVTMTVRNGTDRPVSVPVASVVVGRGAHPTEFVPAPAIGALAPGESTIVAVPVTIAAPAYGDYTIRGEIGGLPLAAPATFEARTQTYPWAVAILTATVAVGYGLGLLRPAIRRLARRPRGRDLVS